VGKSFTLIYLWIYNKLNIYLPNIITIKICCCLFFFFFFFFGAPTWLLNTPYPPCVYSIQLVYIFKCTFTLGRGGEVGNCFEVNTCQNCCIIYIHFVMHAINYWFKKIMVTNYIRYVFFWHFYLCSLHGFILIDSCHKLLDFITICHCKNVLIVFYAIDWFILFLTTCLKYHMFLFAIPIAQVNYLFPLQNMPYLSKTFKIYPMFNHFIFSLYM
jgi:hypothetical protein